MYDSRKPYKQQILRLIQTTWKTPYLSVREGIYPIFERKFSYPEIEHTDGIGTKGIYHWRKRTFRDAVLDALAMNLNDLAMARAIPYKLQSHIILPKDDHEAILSIVRSLRKECKKRKIAITGGETSIHDDAQGMDISMTVSGFVSNPKPNRFKIGDMFIGIKSNGLHSNGFTKIRELFKKEWKKEFVVPTRIYADEILRLLRKYKIHGMMHITGGAFTKLKDILSKELDVVLEGGLKLAPQKIFYEIYRRGLSDEDMYRTFNCGIGFVLSVDAKDAKRIVEKLKNADILGHIVKGRGRIVIHSSFSTKKVVFT